MHSAQAIDVGDALDKDSQWQSIAVMTL